MRGPLPCTQMQLQSVRTASTLIDESSIIHWREMLCLESYSQTSLLNAKWPTPKQNAARSAIGVIAKTIGIILPQHCLLSPLPLHFDKEKMDEMDL